MYLKYYNLLIAQDLWQAHYHILSIIFLKEFIELTVNLDTMIKKCETCRVEYIYFKNDLIEYKCLCNNKNYPHKFDEKLKEQFFNTYKFCNHSNS